MSRIAPTVRIAILAIAIVVAAVFCSLELKGNPAGLLSNAPELRAEHQTLSLTLHAGIASDGKNSFYFNGRPNAPTLRLSPGDQLKITYVNDLPTKAKESCAITPCMDMTNLHFHGLTVSPDAPQDDVLDMMAMPGQSLRYTVQIPKEHPPGLYWYHTHPHGESHRQVLDGMSGAIVIEGMESYFPPLAGLPERVLVVRGRSIVNDPQSTDLKHRVELSSDACGAEPETPEEIFTLNGSVRPQIEIAPGGRQFWRSTCRLRGNRLKSLQWTGCPSPCTTRITGRASLITSCCHRRAGLKPLLLVQRPARLGVWSHAAWIPDQTAIRIQRWY